MHENPKKLQRLLVHIIQEQSDSILRLNIHELHKYFSILSVTQSLTPPHAPLNIKKPSWLQPGSYSIQNLFDFFVPKDAPPDHVYDVLLSSIFDSLKSILTAQYDITFSEESPTPEQLLANILPFSSEESILNIILFNNGHDKSPTIISNIKDIMHRLLNSIITISSMDIQEYSQIHHQTTVREFHTHLELQVFEKLLKLWTEFAGTEQYNHTLQQKWIITQLPHEAAIFIKHYFSSGGIPPWALSYVETAPESFRNSFLIIHQFSHHLFTLTGKKTLTLSSNNSEHFSIDIDEHHRTGHSENHIFLYYKTLYNFIQKDCGVIVRQEQPNTQYVFNDTTLTLEPIMHIDLYGLRLKMTECKILTPEELKRTVMVEGASSKVRFHYKPFPLH